MAIFYLLKENIYPSLSSVLKNLIPFVKNIFFNCCTTLSPSSKLIDHNTSERLNSVPSHFSIFVLASAPQCLNYCHFAVSFDMWKSGSTNFSPSCFYYSRFLGFPNKFQDHLVNFHISFILEPAQ